jgi:DNA-binding response OmpR family regulator
VPHRILIIEDERIIADTLGIILRKRGFECDVAYSAGEALAAAKKAGPHLILGDISLPDGSGLTVVSEIAKWYPECRVILLTGRYSNLRDAQDWVRSHAIPARILTKPLLPALLLQEMDEILRA